MATSSPPPTFRDERLQQQFAEHGYAVAELPGPTVDRLTELYRRIRPRELTEFTASIQVEDGDYRRVAHFGVRDVVHDDLGGMLADHRIVAANYVVKQPGPWVVEPHQDFDFTDESRWRAVLGWIPLHDVDARTGCLHVVPGSHRLATVPRGSGAHRFPFAAALDHLKDRHSIEVPLRRGQFVLYDARTLHWSTANDTDRERVAAAFAAIPADAPLLHHHVEVDGTVTVVAVDDDIYADTPFHGYPVRGEVVAANRLDAEPSWTPATVCSALVDARTVTP